MEDLGLLIKKIDRTLRRNAENDMKKIGLTLSQVDVLHFLIDSGRMTASQKEIEDFLQVSHPATSGIIGRMEKAGLVSTEISINRRMTKSVTITEKGMEIFSRTEAERLKHREELEGIFTEEELEILKSLLKRFSERLQI